MLPRLSFCHWYSFGAGDFGKVQIEIDESDIWEDLSELYINSSDGIWTQTYLDLSAYAGMSVRVAFFFHSDSSSDTVSTGWYIDDLQATIIDTSEVSNPIVSDDDGDSSGGCFIGSST